MNIPDGVFSVPIQIRFVDTDQAGHVNHATFVTFLETARVEWLKIRGTGTALTGVPIIIAKVEVDYKAPINLFDNPIVSVWISRIGGKSFDMDYVVHETKNDQQVVYATGRTVIVYYNYDSLRSEEIPETIRTLLETEKRSPL